jgi:signal transduction histidine kinase
MNKLWVRLTLLLLPVGCVTLSIVGLLTHLLLSMSLPLYVSPDQLTSLQLATLQNYFAVSGSWSGVEAVLEQATFEVQGVQFVVTDADGRTLAVGSPYLVGVVLAHDDMANAAPLVVNGNQVGWLLGRASGAAASRESKDDFLTDVTRWTVVSGLGITLLILGAAILGRIVARPLRNLTRAVRNLAAGELGSQVIVQGTNDTRTLAEAFNTMSRALAQGDTLRRRIAADVAHELRTPVSVLRGHLEAMLDGVFPLDNEHLAIVYDQTIHLAKLVEDLRLLTLAEAQRLPLDYAVTTPAALVMQSVEWFKPLALDAVIKLKDEVQADLPPIRVDAMRIRQVLNNLLINALRHTPEGGEIILGVKRQGTMVRFTISNSGSELTPEDVSQVFTPFWRSAEARVRDREGSGLGLAITQQLVSLHGGQVGVQSEAGWTHFSFEIPAAPC